MNCQVNKPYPPIKVEKKSAYYAKILSHIYASSESELTAILQYSYETFLIQDEPLRKIIKEISIVEMHHLEILGTLIHLLGNDPVFVDLSECKNAYWNSDYIYYDTDFRTMMDINIESEKNNIRNYQMVLNVIEDKYIQEILKRILEDEYLHLEIFMKLRTSHI